MSKRIVAVAGVAVGAILVGRPAVAPDRTSTDRYEPRDQAPMTSEGRATMKRACTTVTLVALFVCSSTTARADVVLEWNAIAVSTLIGQGQNPFAQARFMAITQLAVFEAVNAITGDYRPYLGTVVAPVGASADAAAVAAAYRVLKNYFPLAPNLDPAYAVSLALIPDGSAKSGGIATGEAAAALMIAIRLGDGSSPPQFSLPTSTDPGVWQLTPGCPAAGGIAFQWQNVTPFGIRSADDFTLDPPPSLTSERYTKDYLEVKTFGSMNNENEARPPDRSDVARIYRDTSPTNLLNSAARQVAGAEGRSLSENARALALLNMATSDSLVASFANKYRYNFWRPVTAIRAGLTDGNPQTDADTSFAPYITTPCFPSYPSNHASGTGGGAEVLRRMYGAGGHSIDISSPTLVDAGIVLHYTTFKAITNDVDDARVFGGIHFRFDQEAGGRLGRDVATYVVKHNLRPINDSD